VDGCGCSVCDVCDLGSCLSDGWELVTGCLGCAFGRKLISKSHFRWYSMGVLSSSHAAGINVGSRQPRACRAPTSVV
jgi:hypothetical protein